MDQIPHTIFPSSIPSTWICIPSRCSQSVDKQTAFWACALMEVAALLVHTNMLPVSQSGLGELGLVNTRLRCPDHIAAANTDLPRIPSQPGFLPSQAWPSASQVIVHSVVFLHSSWASGRTTNSSLLGLTLVARHPSYTGLTMCVVGVTMSLVVPGSWIMECSGTGYALYSAVIVVSTLLFSLLNSKDGGRGCDVATKSLEKYGKHGGSECHINWSLVYIERDTSIWYG